MPAVVNLDFETYSAAGYVFDVRRRKWCSPLGNAPNAKRGLKLVGSYNYARHPTTEILCAAYSIDGGPVSLWRPGIIQPRALLDAVRSGANVYAWNSFFEFYIWNFVGCRVFGWPALPLEQTRDTAVYSLAQGRPGKLSFASKSMPGAVQKLDSGTGLITRFCKPRQPSKNIPATRNYMRDDPTRRAEFERYNVVDVEAERSVLDRLPNLSPAAHKLRELDAHINARGVHVDVDAARACKEAVDALFIRMAAELVQITDGVATSANQLDVIRKWLGSHGVLLPDMKADTVTDTLDHWGERYGDTRHAARRVLEIRQALGLASVKKLGTLLHTVGSDGRIRNTMQLYGAERTGRWAGRGVQPHNMPRGSARVSVCVACEAWQGQHRLFCHACGSILERRKWCHDAAVAALEHIKTRPGLMALLDVWGDLLAVISSSLRALFNAAPGKELLCSDYRAIEAVVLAVLAGEQWRVDVFNTHGKIYEMSAAKITGNTLQFYLDHKERTGEHHPDRGTIGKVAELASGYGGGLGAWKQFGADAFMSDEQIEAAKKRWRAESPAIVDFWYGVERAAMQAVRNAGARTWYRSVSYISDGNTLRCYLPSGRALCYQEPRISKVEKWGKMRDELSFAGMNENPKYGGRGWIRLSTYGGRLTENIVQAVSADLLAHGLQNVEPAGYPIVFHVHDEIVSEVDAGAGTIAELETLMGDLPAWAKGWPVIAAGGWRGHRYRKD